MRGIRSFMGSTHIPDMDTTTSTGNDNSFAGPKAQPAGKVSVLMPTDELLCEKMAKVNITLVEGYRPRSSEAGGLLKDQFVRPTNLSPSGMGCFPTTRRRAVALGILCPLGVLTPLN